jgi:hypothetical protein
MKGTLDEWGFAKAKGEQSIFEIVPYYAGLNFFVPGVTTTNSAILTLGAPTIRQNRAFVLLLSFVPALYTSCMPGSLTILACQCTGVVHLVLSNINIEGDSERTKANKAST